MSVALLEPQTIAKRISMAILGQSNEAGFGLFSDRSHYGAPYADKTTDVVGSWWGAALDKLWIETSIWCDITNTAVGATGVVKDWCGDTVGDGTGTPYASGDGGFDPNGYMAAALAGALKAPNTHEAWVYICNGQQDSQTTTLANYQLGLQNAIDYFLANDVKVILGFSCYYAAQAAWYANSGSVAVANILASYSGSDLVKEGANLYTELGIDIAFQDGAHMERTGYNLAAEIVGTKLIEALS